MLLHAHSVRQFHALRISAFRPRYILTQNACGRVHVVFRVSRCVGDVYRERRDLPLAGLTPLLESKDSGLEHDWSIFSPAPRIPPGMSACLLAYIPGVCVCVCVHARALCARVLNECRRTEGSMSARGEASDAHAMQCVR